MCDPLVGGLIAGAASLATGAMQASQLADVQNKQNQANDAWVAYQTKIHREQTAAEDQARQAANAARLDTLQKVSPENQQQEQMTEQQRLNTLYNKSDAGTPQDTSNASNVLLSGEQTGVQGDPGNRSFMNNLTTQVNNATQQARQRIAGLATANSYGGSFGGLGTVVPQQFMQGGNYINMVNDIRQGNLKTYGVEQQVQPLNYAIGSTTSALGGISQALGGLAGKGIGTGMAGWGGGATSAYDTSLGPSTGSWM
jgi:hypothetical protein